MRTNRRSHFPNYKVRRVLTRFSGAVCLLAIPVSVAALLLSLALAIYPQDHRGFDVVPRAPYTHAFDPIAVVAAGLPPDSPVEEVAQLVNGPRDPATRYIAVFPEKVELVAGGTVAQTIPVATVSTMSVLVRTVNNPDWIAEPMPGHVVVKAAIVTQPRTKLTISAPEVTDVAMLSMPTVFIATRGGTLNFDGVHVHSAVVPQSSNPKFRPFVLAADSGFMSIRNSQMTDLGWDWNASYGVSWEQHATGEAVNSVFERNFIGAYSGRANGLSFVNSVFRDNDLYGLDPHTYSKNLTVDGVLAEGNRAHGIIFSDYVRNSVVKNSTSRNNGENGIMMDQHSTGNHIAGNTVYGNHGDGLVTARSSRNVFADNVVERNRVGIRVSPDDVATTGVHDNRFLHNETAAENIRPDGSNQFVGNGGQWNIPVLKRIWAIAGLVLAIAALAIAVPIGRKPLIPQPVLAAVAAPG